jgi:micrococcal nuclease
VAKADRWTLDGMRRLRRRRRFYAVMKPIIVLLVTAGATFAITGFAVRPSAAGPVTYVETVTSCRVTDGDTIRCGDERIRLLGIDAPEMPGHCRPGRQCVAGDPYASTDSLDDAMASSMTIERAGSDHYGRTLAIVAGPKGDLSCRQLNHGRAIYKPQWDNGLRVARTCPRAIL